MTTFAEIQSDFQDADRRAAEDWNLRQNNMFKGPVSIEDVIGLNSLRIGYLAATLNRVLMKLCEEENAK
jgi:hypothetical protein